MSRRRNKRRRTPQAFDSFLAIVNAAHLSARKCRDEDHWQIHGGRKLVNVWACRGGYTIYVDRAEASYRGTVDDAIAAAEAPPIEPRKPAPWQETEQPTPPQEHRVGLLRWLFRWLW